MEDPETAHLVRCDNTVPHDLYKGLQPILVAVGAAYLSDVFGSLLSLFAPLQFKLNQVGVDGLFGCQVDDGLFLIRALVNQVAVVSREIDNLDIGWDVFQGLAEQVEVSVCVMLC